MREDLERGSSPRAQPGCSPAFWMESRWEAQPGERCLGRRFGFSRGFTSHLPERIICSQKPVPANQLTRSFLFLLSNLQWLPIVSQINPISLTIKAQHNRAPVCAASEDCYPRPASHTPSHRTTRSGSLAHFSPIHPILSPPPSFRFPPRLLGKILLLLQVPLPGDSSTAPCDGPPKANISLLIHLFPWH